MHKLAALVLLPLALFAAVETPVYVGDRNPHRITAIATDAAGNTYAVGTRTFYASNPSGQLPLQSAEAFAAKFDASNTQVWIQYFSGKLNDAATAVAIDGSGNVYVGGSTTSPNFPLHSPLRAEPGGAFLMKLSGDGSRVLWSTYFGGLGTEISSLAVAPDGGLVVGGQVVQNSFGSSKALVAKVNAAGSSVEWEQLFGGVTKVCSPGSTCFLSPTTNSARIALDPAGNIYVAGVTNAIDFPTTSGAYLSVGIGPYVRKLAPDGTLLWSTYIADNRVPESPRPVVRDNCSALAVGADGSVYITGAGSSAWPTTPNTYRSTFSAALGADAEPYLTRLSADGKSLLYSTYLGRNAAPSSVVLDSAGNAVVALSGSYYHTADYLMTINPAATAALSNLPYPAGSRAAGIAVDPTGKIHAAADAGLLTNVDRATPSTGLAGIINAAGSTISGRIAPGELVSIYGWNLGQQVYVDELPAPVLYASANQVNAIVPFGVTGRERVTLTTKANGTVTASGSLGVATALPEVFKIGSTTFAAALNQDGTVNSEENPAKAGSVVSVWGTGAPGWPANTVDGSLNSNSLFWLNLGVVQNYSQVATEVTYAGSAPGMPAGVFQVNFRLPEQAYPMSSESFYVASQLVLSEPFSIWVKP